MSLQYTFSFSKNISLASAIQLSFRTDSNHCRRYPENCSFLRCRLSDVRRTFQQKACIDRRFESSPESRGSQTSGVLLVLFVHAKRINPFPFREASRFRKPRNSAPQPQLRTATIKTFLWELRGFVNLEVAHIAGNFAQSNLILLELSEVYQTLFQRCKTSTSHCAQTNVQ